MTHLERLKAAAESDHVWTPFQCGLLQLSIHWALRQLCTEDKNVITPTVGRVVWYYPFGRTQIDANEQPQAAIIAHVHTPSCVNLAFFDSNGNARSATSVPLIQGDDQRPDHGFCEWMPYQKGQAAKTEALGKQLAPA